jgi:hypothetical protein
MGAVDGKDGEAIRRLTANVAGDLSGFSIPGVAVRVAVGGQNGITGLVVRDFTKRNPGVVTIFPAYGSKQITDDRGGDK